LFDGIAVENDAEKPQLGNVEPVFADGSYSIDVSTEVARIAAGTTSEPAEKAPEIVRALSVVQSGLQDASAYAIPKALSVTFQEREVSDGLATVLEVKAVPSQETLTWAPL